MWALFCLFLFYPFKYFIIFCSRLDMLYRMINTEVNSFMLAVEHIFPSVWGCVNLVRFGLHLKFALLWLLSVYQSFQISPVIFYFCFSAWFGFFPLHCSLERVCIFHFSQQYYTVIFKLMLSMVMEDVGGNKIFHLSQILWSCSWECSLYKCAFPCSRYIDEHSIHSTLPAKFKT